MAAHTVSAQEAAALLDISLNSLYSYVSRGQVRTVPDPDDSRARRYLREDIERLLQRKSYRRDPKQAARDALDWGEPVLESALTLIQDEGHAYRGQAALALAETMTFEAVAGLLWLDDPAEGEAIFASVGGSPLHERLDLRRTCEGLIGVLSAIDDVAAYQTTPDAVAGVGAYIIRHIVTAIGGGPIPVETCAGALAQVWAPPEDIGRLRRLIDLALILCADHELNASSFAVRVAAGTGANLYLAVIAGLVALSGHRHGGASRRVESFMRGLETFAQGEEAVADALRRGDAISGFGHPLYPEGDPRATSLLAAARAAYPQASVWGALDGVCAAMERHSGLKPNIDLALVALVRAARLPQGAPLALFALGRSAGWIAHAIEQYALGTMIRPRARYVGR